jgi:hypothetical protein
LGKESASIFSFRYGLEAGGNVLSRQDIEGWLKGKNVLYEAHCLCGYVTTPVTVINGTVVVGFDTSKIHAALAS